MPNSDETIARAGAVLDRMSERYRSAPARARRTREVGRRLVRVAAADTIVILAAILFGLVVGPIGIMGFFAVMISLVAVTIGVAMLPTERIPTADQLPAVALRALPARTSEWLDTQRKLLPAPAQTLVDGIGVRLDTLSPQLASLSEEQPAAAELRALIGEQLPNLIRDYAKVPVPLRSTPRNGKSPDAQLADGLRLIEAEIGEMSEHIAQGDLDSLATRGRFLEIKYRDESAV